ncbi:DNA-binding transcription factor yap1 [Coemansia sp. RSA 1939]|nr:DNA-binding transcription factor yap1 [Coemansia sp. RSA 1939]
MELFDSHDDITPQKRLQDKADSDDSQDNRKKRPGRKLITTEASTKRTAQNRAAQRAFRERKQQYLKDLEDQVRELTEQRERTERENQELKQRVGKLKQENTTLKGGNFTYENTSVDFDKAMSDLFDPASATSNIDLRSAYDTQQKSLQSTDPAKSSSVAAVHPPQLSSRSTSSASPQSVPAMYPNFDMTSTSSAMFASTLAAQHNSPYGSVVNNSSNVAGGGFSSDIFNGIQLLASNNNISTGSFLGNVLDTPNTNGNSARASISPPPPSSDRRSSTLGSSSGYGTNGIGASPSPSISTNAATPNDMFVPLNTVSSNTSNGALFGMDTLKGQQPSDFAQLAALLQQSQQTTTSTPAFNELFSLSPSSVAASSVASDSIATLVSNGANSNIGQQSTASFDAIIANGSGATSLAGFESSIPPSLSLLMPPQSDAPAYKMPQITDLPSNLMAYRNPDPLSLADDSDQLEKLLLDTMYPVKGQNMNADGLSSFLTTQNRVPNGLLKPASTASSTISASAEANTDQQPAQSGNGALECTCRNCDSAPCAPCPKHGSPGDISEELRGIAPEMLSYVCTTSNTMADEELDDLCSLMYKHAKCSEVQQRVQQVRERLKNESNLEMLNTKKQLAKQYGLQ